MGKTGVGVIGVGSFGEAHVQAYRALREVEIVALCDTREDRLREMATKYGIAHTYTDARELCARRDIELVSIVTPGVKHLEPVLAAAKAGKHILLEKPIATSMKEAEAIVQAAATAGVHLMVGHILRFENNYGTLGREIAQGNLGKIVSIRAQRNRPRWVYRTILRGHPFLEDSIHDIDLCLWYTQDQVRSVRAFTRHVQGDGFPEINWAFLEFRSGCVACLESQWLIPDPAGVTTNDAIQVIGTKGVADIHFVPASLNLWKEQGPESLNVSYDATFAGKIWGAIKEEVGHFVDCVRSGVAPEMVTPGDACAALKVALALVQSAQEQRDVTID